MIAPLVALRTAGRRVEDRWLWRGVDLEVAPGDRLAVRGPSGSGKTVLLRALAGLDALDEGDLEADGQAVQDLPRHRASTALVSQRPALFEGTVRDNLEVPFAYAVHDLEYDEERARDLVARLGRDPGVLDQRVDGLSGGEAQTVGLVRALLTDPMVLLLDEPTAGLDPDRTSALEVVIDAFLEDGDRAVVWTGHDAEQIARVTDRALEL